MNPAFVIVGQNGLVAALLNYSDPPTPLAPGQVQYVCPPLAVQVGWRWNQGFPAPISSVPPPPDPTKATISNGDSVPVRNSAGAAIGTGTAEVAASALTDVKMPATIAGVANGASVVVHDAAGASVAGSPGAAEVALGVLTDVKLTV